MSRWQMKLEIKDIMEKIRSGEWTLQDGAKEIIKRMEELRPIVEENFPEYIEDFEEAIDEFEIFAESDDMNDEVEEFDYRLGNLYDWGDIALDEHFGGKKMCWINNM